jgi:hypothetical protein
LVHFSHFWFIWTYKNLATRVLTALQAERFRPFDFQASWSSSWEESAEAVLPSVS